MQIHFKITILFWQEYDFSNEPFLAPIPSYPSETNKTLYTFVDRNKCVTMLYTNPPYALSAGRYAILTHLMCYRLTDKR